MMVCPQCGATSDEGQRFCYNCGARLDSPQPVGAQPAAFPPPPVAVAPPQQEQGLPPAPAPLQYGSYQQPAPQAYLPQAIPNSTLAIVSLVCGILAWVVLPLLAAIPAVITGHMARNEIRRSGGRVSGDGLALIGMVLGYANLAVAALGICALLAFFVLAVAAA